MARNVVELRPRRAPAAPPAWYECWLEHDGAEVVVLEAASRTAGSGSRNAWLTRRRVDGIRLAVIDGGRGAASPAAPAHSCGLDAPAWAAQVSRAALHADDDIAVCLWRANRALHEPAVGRAGERAQAAVVAADLRVRIDGALRATVVRAGDCVAYARRGHRWTALFEDACIAFEAAQVLDAWHATHRDATGRERHAAEERALGSPNAWRTAAIGRFAEPLVEWVDIEGCDELVLANAPAQLDSARLDDLGAWIDGHHIPHDPNVSHGDDALIVRWQRVDDRHPSRHV